VEATIREGERNFLLILHAPPRHTKPRPRPCVVMSLFPFFLCHGSPSFALGHSRRGPCWQDSLWSLAGVLLDEGDNSGLRAGQVNQLVCSQLIMASLLDWFT
jgi:hypothetical protein